MMIILGFFLPGLGRLAPPKSNWAWEPTLLWNQSHQQPNRQWTEDFEAAPSVAVFDGWGTTNAGTTGLLSLLREVEAGAIARLASNSFFSLTCSFLHGAVKPLQNIERLLTFSLIGNQTFSVAVVLNAR
jgi:hypothetical protein